jgi:hypothetical protein
VYLVYGNSRARQWLGFVTPVPFPGCEGRPIGKESRLICRDAATIARGEGLLSVLVLGSNVEQ